MAEKKLTVIFASTKFRGHQLYDQRLARALATDRPVLYVEPQVPILGLGRVKEDEIDFLENENLAVFVPKMLPYGRRRALYGLTGILFAIQVWAYVLIKYRRTGIDLIVIAASSSSLLFFRARDAVFLVKDDYEQAESLVGVSKRALQTRFRRMMSRARKVVVVSPVLRDILLTRGLRSVVVPAGCSLPSAHWPEPTDMADVPQPRVLFIGMMSDRIDIELLIALADAGMQIVVVGETQRTFTNRASLAELESRENYRRLSPRTGTELEAVIQHCAVGVIPYAMTHFNLASFPLKAFEYLACGKPVVSTRLPAMEWLNSPCITIADDVDSFTNAVRYWLDPERCDSIASRCKALAANNTWDFRAQSFSNLLERPGSEQGISSRR
ncbi:glycosyltransferase [Actinomycetes bacterium M1A6_2h]